MKGIGTIRLRMHNRVDRISQVRYVHELKKKLISPGNLESNGYSWTKRIFSGYESSKEKLVIRLLGNIVVGGSSMVQNTPVHHNYLKRVVWSLYYLLILINSAADWG